RPISPMANLTVLCIDQGTLFEIRRAVGPFHGQGTESRSLLPGNMMLTHPLYIGADGQNLPGIHGERTTTVRTLHTVVDPFLQTEDPVFAGPILWVAGKS